MTSPSGIAFKMFNNLNIIKKNIINDSYMYVAKFLDKYGKFYSAFKQSIICENPSTGSGLK